MRTVPITNSNPNVYHQVYVRNLSCWRFGEIAIKRGLIRRLVLTGVTQLLLSYMLTEDLGKLTDVKGIFVA